MSVLILIVFSRPLVSFFGSYCEKIVREIKAIKVHTHSKKKRNKIAIHSYYFFFESFIFYESESDTIIAWITIC